ncbi:HD domain-containing protein [Microbulbifer sp. ANSA001]|uniref:HD domain-containing protein n=1 Tax=Microbulbifer sp. ANSA001 TaxID=3243358 RepID=UPI004043007D
MELTTNKIPPPLPCLACRFVTSSASATYTRTIRYLKREHIQYVAKEVYQIPDSMSCKKALDMVAQCSPDFLLNHSLRSYTFGLAMSHKVKTVIDQEVYFLGAIMHDIGLTPAYDVGGTFELDGAQAARSFCIGHNISTEKADLVHEMIAHHNSVGIAHKKDPEIALLHFAAGLDIAGLWLSDIHPKTLSEVINEYPRLDFKQGMQSMLNDQVGRKPHSYMRPFVELGFLKKIEETPF